MNELAMRIHSADRLDPTATIQIAARWTFFGRLSQPKTQMPRNVDSRKKASRA